MKSFYKKFATVSDKEGIRYKPLELIKLIYILLIRRFKPMLVNREIKCARLKISSEWFKTGLALFIRQLRVEQPASVGHTYTGRKLEALTQPR